MAGSTKILTVSYGTFSCTLEGFDDSFHSMKAIAEYFRDLAQDDRYFGAEPPAPDAEMLARIAEREISRRVEAQMDGKGIRLRAEMPEHEAAPIASAPESAVAMPPVAEAPAAAETPSSLMPAASLMAAVAEPQVEAPRPTAPLAEMTPEAPAHPDAESVAAKLQRIRAVVGKPTQDADDGFEDTAGTDEAPTIDEAIVAEPDLDVTANDIMHEEPVEAPVASDVDVNTQVTTDAAAFDDDEDVAADVQAFEDEAEADVATQEETIVTEEAVAIDPIETTDVAEDIAVDEVVVAEVEADVAADAPEDDATEVAEDLSADLNDIDMPVAPVVETPKPPVRARIVRLRKDKPAEVVEAPAAAEDTSDADITQRVSAALKVETPVEEDVVQEVTPTQVEAEIVEAPEVEVAAKIDDAVVESVEAEAEVADTLLADDTPTETASDHDAVRAAVAAAIPAGSLSDDDEDDLQRELASLADDVVTIEDEAPEVQEIVVEDVIMEDVAALEDEAIVAELSDDAVEMPEVVEAPVRSRREMLPEADDAAMSRIDAQTDEALNEPTGSRRRNAIAQLKAAVAATEAARQLGDKSDGEAEAQEAFRDDLDQVVRPRRPASPDEQDLRSERPRTTPLKLVASQRVDEEGENTSDDVQPRRVASQPVDASDTGGFAQFAAQMGATELPDLLEAAAAYTSFVEGVEDFSRPQIMKKVQLTTEEEFSREDGLRSFGTLLRQGRISKVRNGRFQISEQTRFRPDARSA